MASNPVEQAATAADDARTRVSATMDDIQNRLDPRRILEDTVARVQTGSKALAVQAGDVAKAHPLAVGAAVAALGLALFARNRLANATVNLGDGTEDYTDYDDDYSDPVPYDVGAPRLQALAGDTRETVEANPGVAIVVGLIAGAVLGALLPVSETERRTLGKTGNRLGAAARAAARRAADELDAAGLSVDNVKAKAGEATQKARIAAKSVVDAARAELKD
jgi:ElaB/YqjD/DUF883 family membrane-anchored ribosome-binding protein